MQSHATYSDIWTYAAGRLSLKAVLHVEVYVKKEEVVCAQACDFMAL